MGSTSLMKRKTLAAHIMKARDAWSHRGLRAGHVDIGFLGTWEVQLSPFNVTVWEPHQNPGPNYVGYADLGANKLVGMVPVIEGKRGHWDG